MIQAFISLCFGKVHSNFILKEKAPSLFLILKWKTTSFATGHINNTRKIRNDMFPLDENSQSKSISPRARTFGDPFTFSCSNYQEIHTISLHRNPKILNNTRLSFRILIRKIIKKKRAKTEKCYQKNSI